MDALRNLKRTAIDGDENKTAFKPIEGSPQQQQQ